MFFVLVFLLVIGMGLEALGVSIVLPFLSVVSVPFNQLDNIYILSLIEILDIQNQNQLILFFLFAFIIFFFLKTIFLIYITHKQNLFLQNFNARITSKLFEKFLNQEYSYYLKKSYTEMHKILFQDTTYLDVYCSSIIILFSEFTLFIGIIITVLIVDPIGSLFSVLVISIMSALFYFFNRIKLKKWSQEREKIEKEISRVALESLKGYKEILIFQKTIFFHKIFSNQKYTLNNLKAKFKTMNVIPRYYIEFIAVIALSVYVISYIKLDDGSNFLLPTLGVFVAAIFKISPSINKIINAFQNLKFYNSSVQLIFNELNNDNFISSHLEKTKSIPNFETLDLNNIKFKYSKAGNVILENINLNIKKGDIIGIIGKSGEGKTTLIDLVFGFLRPNEGQIIINNSISIYDNLDSWRDKISYVSQDPFLLNSTILENIAFGQNKESINQNFLQKVIKQSQLEKLLKNLPNGINTIIGDDGSNLSGGQRQRVAIARVLFKKSELIIFDESTSNLDEKVESDILNIIESLKPNKTIIFITHSKNPLKICNKIFKIDSKKISQIQ